MADAEFIFRVVSEGDGDGKQAGRGTGPVPTKPVGDRTARREDQEARQGGGGAAVTEKQRKSVTERRGRKKPPPPPGELKAPPTPGELRQKRAAEFGQLALARLGLGGLGLGGAAAVFGVAAVGAGVLRGAARAQATARADLRPFSGALQMQAAREEIRDIRQRLALAEQFGGRLAELDKAGRLSRASRGFRTRVAAGPIGAEASAGQELIATGLDSASAFQDVVGEGLGGPLGSAAGIAGSGRRAFTRLGEGDVLGAARSALTTLSRLPTFLSAQFALDKLIEPLRDKLEGIERNTSKEGIGLDILHKLEHLDPIFPEELRQDGDPVRQANAPPALLI